MRELFTVIYRTGGTLNFAWRKTLICAGAAHHLKTAAADLARAGYPALILPADMADMRRDFDGNLA